MDQIVSVLADSLSWFVPSTSPWFILIGASVITAVIAVFVLGEEFVTKRKKKETVEERTHEEDLPKMASKARVKAQLKTLDKAPKGKITWL